MNFHQLECLVAVSETGTVSEAAELLMFSQPALTRTIKSLENELGYPLFERSKNRLTLNEYGEIVLKYAKEILSEKKQMDNSLSIYHKNRQKIVIGSIAPAPLWGCSIC